MTKNTRTILGWCFYDFANQPFTTIVVTFIYSAYFISGIVVGDEAMGQVYWGNAVTVCAIIIALLSPVMGAAADQGGYRKSFLLFWTWVCIIFSILLFFPQKGDIYTALILFSIANIAFEMGQVFCNAYVPDLSKSNNMGKISGYGYAFGYLGGLLALLFGLLTIALPEQPMFGISGDLDSGEKYRAMNILVAIWFIIFSLPTFLWLDKDKRKKKLNFTLAKDSFSQLRETFSNIKKIKNTFRFLVARLFYNDALITMFSFGGIIAKSIYGFELEKMLVFGILLGVAAGIGAFLMGYIDDYIGPKKTIQISNLLLIIATIMVVFIDNETIFWIAGFLVGFAAGPNQASSRSLMARLSPKDKQNEFFGFFAFSGKITAFLGPFLLAQVTLFSLSYLKLSNELAQRAGISVVLLLIIIGSVVLHFVDEENKPQ
jgi:UMF1 family MFS transporter